jgi:hypothetical protein
MTFAARKLAAFPGGISSREFGLALEALVMVHRAASIEPRFGRNPDALERQLRNVESPRRSCLSEFSGLA